ncbi:YheC/YheD family protein [Paenibacillus sp. JCM 10914]|uniref:YheC/YheD family protein n=1 Tax=Paenibacillus sp. JCM 10914 TaxID=1236974 RepID=UPI001E52C1E0|nr:YheC/YheD family protein [Paenibacillus sp. JCM 10914]
MTIQRVASKWAKTKIILNNKGLASYVPSTRQYTLEALEEMLNIHTLVFIKPDRGTYGIGVMSVEELAIANQLVKLKRPINCAMIKKRRYSVPSKVFITPSSPSSRVRLI